MKKKMMMMKRRSSSSRKRRREQNRDEPTIWCIMTRPAHELSNRRIGNGTSTSMKSSTS